MWPFKKKPETVAPPQPAVGLPQLHFDWRRLPTIQRTIGEHPLTIPIGKFSADLSTQADPRALAEPLGHHVSLEAPTGIVLGVTRPQTRSDGPALVGRAHAVRAPSVQRMAIEDDSGVDVETPDVSAGPDAGAAASPDQPRHLPVVADTRPSVQLTRVTSDNGPLPLAPLQAMTEAGEDPAPPEVQTVAEPAAEVPSYPRLTLGQARRLGLGAPMKHLPETAIGVQRATDSMTSTAKPAAPAEPAANADTAPELPWFPLDAIVNLRKEVIAPAPISRPQRIPMPLAVSRSAETAPASADLSSAVGSTAEPTTAPALAPDAPGVQRFAQRSEPDAAAQTSPTPTEPHEVQTAAIEDSASWSAPTGQPSAPGQWDSDPGMPSRTEEPGGQLAGAMPLITQSGSTRTIQRAAATGEADEGSSAGLPSLPLATMAAIQRADATAPITQIRSIDSPDEDGATGEADEGTAATLPSLPLASPSAVQRTAAAEPMAQASTPEHTGRDLSRHTSAPRSWMASGDAPVMAPNEARVMAPLVGGRMPILSSVQRFAESSGSSASRATDWSRADGRHMMPAASTLAPSAGRATLLEEPGEASGPGDWPLESPVNDTVLQRASSSDLPLAFARPPTATTSDSAVQRAAIGEPSFGPQAFAALPSPTSAPSTPDGGEPQWAVQRTAVADWSASSSPEVSVQSAAEPAAVVTSPGASDEDDEAHLHELAGKLYERIRSRLRNELLVDRERAGLLTDLR